jgi:hypothetical protein
VKRLLLVEKDVCGEMHPPMMIQMPLTMSFMPKNWLRHYKARGIEAGGPTCSMFICWSEGVHAARTAPIL